MAYTHRFNPDALPAHAEPNEAAQILAQAQSQTQTQSTSSQTSQQQQQQPQRTSPPKPNSSGTSPNFHAESSYQNKPPPPLPPLPGQKFPSFQGQSPDPNFRPQSTTGADSHGRSHSASIPYRSHASSNATQPIRSPAQSYNAFSPPSANNYGTSPTPGPMPGAYPQNSYNGGGGGGVGPNFNSNGNTYSQQQEHRDSRSQSHSPRPPQGLGVGSLGSGGGDPGLIPLFRAVDTQGHGKLGEAELQKALLNDEYNSFDPQTVRLMIKMFDQNRRGYIGFEEFCGLWGFLAAWRSLFRRFDTDRSGAISLDEFTKALVAFGYNLSPGFVEMTYRIYDKRGNETMSFDMFVQSCISLKRMTDVFKRYDADRDGYITLSFEEFLTEIMNQR